jgi:hypothetical protein
VQTSRTAGTAENYDEITERFQAVFGGRRLRQIDELPRRPAQLRWPNAADQAAERARLPAALPGRRRGAPAPQRVP